jgi:hypothetical protein
VILSNSEGGEKERDTECMCLICFERGRVRADLSVDGMYYKTYIYRERADLRKGVQYVFLIQRFNVMCT